MNVGISKQVMLFFGKLGNVSKVLRGLMTP